MFLCSYIDFSTVIPHDSRKIHGNFRGILGNFRENSRKFPDTPPPTQSPTPPTHPFYFLTSTSIFSTLVFCIELLIFLLPDSFIYWYLKIHWCWYLKIPPENISHIYWSRSCAGKRNGLYEKSRTWTQRTQPHRKIKKWFKFFENFKKNKIPFMCWKKKL